MLNVAQDRLAKRVQAVLAGAGGGESSREAGDSKEAREGERMVKREEEESHVTNPDLKGVSTILLEKVCCILLSSTNTVILIRFITN